jgi:hypothetical protein
VFQEIMMLFQAELVRCLSKQLNREESGGAGSGQSRDGFPTDGNGVSSTANEMA